MGRVSAILGAAALMVSTALANDTSAVLTTGGLEFVNNARS
jgi:hypothetical protein